MKIFVLMISEKENSNDEDMDTGFKMKYLLGVL